MSRSQTIDRVMKRYAQCYVDGACTDSTGTTTASADEIGCPVWLGKAMQVP